MPKKHFKSGEEAPFSGIYEIIGTRGGHTGEERTVVEGEPFPPTLESGQSFEVVRKTKH